MKVPASLIVDDGAPVNLLHWLHPHLKSAFIVPNAFTRDFADVSARHGVRGKFRVLPMPSALGRIDGELNHVSRRHLRGFLDIVREKIAPHYDITPEILTHQAAVDLRRGNYLHLYGDEWVARATVGEMTDYIAEAVHILRKVGLPANGVTSPWATGQHNEKQYAEAIGRARHRRSDDDQDGRPLDPAHRRRDRSPGAGARLPEHRTGAGPPEEGKPGPVESRNSPASGAVAGKAVPLISPRPTRSLYEHRSAGGAQFNRWERVLCRQEDILVRPANGLNRDPGV